jgi:hypothetical protein
MDAVYLEIRAIARRIVAGHPRPDLYIDHAADLDASLNFYESDGTITRLRGEMRAYLENDFGHGMGHSEKVAIDAGALVIIESRLAGCSETLIGRNLLMAQCAGLLHDICRKENAHAEKGAAKAGGILKGFPLPPEEAEAVCTAIRNHEAFTSLEALPADPAGLISDCLYDADKFRWGPDNFSHTIWDMVNFVRLPLERFLDHYPKGMALLKKIRGTFRSRTGRRYGPQFIDTGIAIGEELYQIILSDFADR